MWYHSLAIFEALPFLHVFHQRIAHIIPYLRHEFEVDKRNSDAWVNINPSQALINTIMWHDSYLKIRVSQTRANIQIASEQISKVIGCCIRKDVILWLLLW
jgi:hypothetical protein